MSLQLANSYVSGSYGRNPRRLAGRFSDKPGSRVICLWVIPTAVGLQSAARWNRANTVSTANRPQRHGPWSAREISNVLSVRLRNGLTNKSGRIAAYFVSVGHMSGAISKLGTSSISSEFASQSFEESDRRGGFSASIGAEHKLNDNWSITGSV